MMRLTKNSNLLCAGHDSGFEIWQINKDSISPHCLIGKDLIVFAQDLKTFLLDL